MPPSERRKAAKQGAQGRARRRAAEAAGRPASSQGRPTGRPKGGEWRQRAAVRQQAGRRSQEERARSRAAAVARRAAARSRAARSGGSKGGGKGRATARRAAERPDGSSVARRATSDRSTMSYFDGRAAGARLRPSRGPGFRPRSSPAWPRRSSSGRSGRSRRESTASAPPSRIALGQVLELADATGGDHRDRDRVGDGAGQLEVVADRWCRRGPCSSAGSPPPRARPPRAPRRPPRGPRPGCGHRRRRRPRPRGARQPGVDRDDHALAAEDLGELADQLRAGQRRGVDRDLVGAGVEHGLGVGDRARCRRRS